MIVRFHGAAHTVTGSMHLVESNGTKILLDCGLYQGKRREAFARNRTLPFDAASLDAVVLSHAHIDHSGNLPSLVKAGFRGDIFATPATRDLCAVMLADSAHIQQKEAEFLSRKNREVVGPLYDAKDAAATIRRIVSVPLGRSFRVAPSVCVTFHEAGHMLGSAGVVLEAQEGGRTVRLGFSGDVGHEGDPILPSPVPVGDVDALVMECTYGDRTHPPAETRTDQLLALVQRTIQRGGRLIIPAFAVGRTQFLVYTLNSLFNAGRLPALPIFVDSPLATNVTEIFRTHLDDLDPELRASLHGDRDPFGFARLTYTRSVEESKALNARPGACVIISASGMCESGRIVHHLRNNLGDPRNTVLIAGFQAPHTLGRRLVERAPAVTILGETVPLRAEVATASGFSAHADQGELAAYARAAAKGGRLKRVHLVHGEAGPAAALTEMLKKEGMAQVDYPDRGEERGVG